MKNLLLIIPLFFILSFGMFFVFSSDVNAEALDACDFLPCSVDTDSGTSDPNILNPNFSAKSLIRYGINSIFMLFLIAGIALIVKAAITMLKSEGNEEQVQKSVTTVKSAFIGLALIVFGLVGIFLVAVLFGATGIFSNSLEDAKPEGLDFESGINQVL